MHGVTQQAGYLKILPIVGFPGNSIITAIIAKGFLEDRFGTMALSAFLFSQQV